ncbi:short chain dehydrogenase family protein [Metarhizium robertsii]|uniref:Short chain dehydrogenase family protein n=1 Tax=Metarhizium robertsii TaxID=568076 RepID=A0A0A1UUW2_9HYPO|nr:short chain dehydrogenase family protein [Metarhizium robertsii]
MLPINRCLRPFRTASVAGCAARFVHDASKHATRKSLLPEFDLTGKVVVVSGGTRGLGLAQAQALLDAGANVHCIDKTLPVDSPSPDLTYHEADVRNVHQINKVMSKIADDHGRLDGLIAAAGIKNETSALEFLPDQVENIMSVNVIGTFMTAQAAARQMIRLKRPGSICLVASMSGSVANRGMPSSLAAEWGEHGIRVNTLSPGYITTEVVQSLLDEFPERRESWSRDNMLNRLSLPAEYRGAAVFLLSDASSFMTGSDLRIDGGHVAW